MKTTQSFTDDHQVRVTAEFEQETLEGFKRKAARKIAQKSRIPGFRPGKAPYNMVVSHVGEGAVLEEAIELMLDDVYPKVLEQENIEPYGPGNLENIPTQEPPVFEFLIPLAPKTELNDLDALKKPYAPEPVTDADIENFIKQLQQDAANVVPFEGAAQEGHLIYMTVTATNENPAEGEDSVLVKDSPQQTQIPTELEEKETEWPFKGFARAFIGKKAEEVVTIIHVFPEDEKLGSYSGKTIKFDANLQSVKALELPALDEEFLQKLGNFNSVEELREVVVDKLETERTAEYDDNYYLELVDTLRKSAIMKYPPQMIEDEEHEVLHRIEHDLEHRGLDLDVYLKLRKQDKEQFIEEEVKPTAKDRLERSMVMDAIAKEYNLKISQSDLQKEVTALINSLLMSGEYDQLEKEMGKKRFTEAISSQAGTNAIETIVRHQLRLMASPESIQNEEELVEDNLETLVQEAVNMADEAKSVSDVEEALTEEIETTDSPEASDDNGIEE